MSGPAEVVSVIRHDVRPGSEPAYEAWTRTIVPLAQAFPGHRGVAVIRPAAGSQRYTVVLHFDSRDHLQRWLESDTRQRMLAEIEPHLTGPGEVEIRPGLDFWIPAPGERRAPALRQFAVALSVIYPLALVSPPLLAPLFAAAPPLNVLAVRTLASSMLIVWLMTYIIMPRYTRAIGWWLYR